MYVSIYRYRKFAQINSGHVNTYLSEIISNLLMAKKEQIKSVIYSLSLDQYGLSISTLCQIRLVQDTCIAAMEINIIENVIDYFLVLKFIVAFMFLEHSKNLHNIKRLVYV